MALVIAMFSDSRNSQQAPIATATTSSRTPPAAMLSTVLARLLIRLRPPGSGTPASGIRLVGDGGGAKWSSVEAIRLSASSDLER
ncbi:hypothetical protein GCM10022247_23380 [Allokutzneria multivorans]|uniref:Uncharacterized protein n=1 Tax=Allokutzneria multivorans TaxID=1142134 RepID=A0ABP7RTU7_9PSEU